MTQTDRAFCSTAERQRAFRTVYRATHARAKPRHSRSLVASTRLASEVLFPWRAHLSERAKENPSVNATLCLAYAIAWAGPGRGSVSPVLVQSISTTVTAFFFAGLMWLTRRMPQPTEVRRQAARVLPFRSRGGQPRSRAILAVLTLMSVGLAAPGNARAQSPAPAPSEEGMKARMPCILHDENAQRREESMKAELDFRAIPFQSRDMRGRPPGHGSCSPPHAYGCARVSCTSVAPASWRDSSLDSGVCELRRHGGRTVARAVAFTVSRALRGSGLDARG